MPKVLGILETALYVDDLSIASDFYQRVLGFELMTSSERLHALSVAGRQVLLLFQRGESVRPASLHGGVIPPTDGQGSLHLAFAIPDGERDAWKRKLSSLGITVVSEVSWERGGRSIYFHDPDGHVIELATPGIWPQEQNP